MEVKITHLYKKGPGGDPTGPKLKDVVRVDGEKVGYIERQDGAHLQAIIPRARFGRAEWNEIIRECAKIRGEEGLYLPGADAHFGVPTQEQMDEALAKVNEQLDDEEGDDDE